MESGVHQRARAQLEAERSDLQRRINELDDALGRLANGTYGTCEVCLCEISDERLLESPTSRHCDDCSSAQATVLTASPNVE